jgi:murein DD-endopeptidase MepM/ murein hydrolase activator NlpD
MIWPTVGRVTQGVSGWHTALDIANSTGTAISAADGGCIVYSGWDNTGYGYTILIDHGKLRTRYAHMSRLYYSYGDCVNRGTVIGAMGSTGNSTGPHLHFEVIIEGYGRVNPYGYLP